MAAGSSSSTSLTRRCMNDEQGETPHILCYCGLRATLWTSWKETNPSRRFFSCPKFRERGCDFFLWHDPELSERTKGIINDLKRDNKKLQMEISELKKSNMYIESAVDCNVLLDLVNNSVTMKLSDEICLLNRKFRVDEMILLKEREMELEAKIVILVEDKEVLALELYHVKEEKNNLEQRRKE
ncbi:hypothetical protein ZIOFF_028092 [Zingiber officinale]|uniref:GRF-type domain-containing protein n=1 Tax=Zingiber officinale TaxID=94328 RepID=A0A8J5GU01_ZINOF|nr:hypothetical protein ZIOFF_028092 [Zingiber officinale]